MCKYVCDRISLEERLQRLDAGYASSSQVSRYFIDTFCSTPVIPVLQTASGSSACRQLEGLLEKTVPGCFPLETVTFGDLAGLIVDWEKQLQNNLSAKDQITQTALEQLIALYFLPLEHGRQTFIDTIIRQTPYRLKDVPQELWAVRDFLFVNMKDYVEYCSKANVGTKTIHEILHRQEQLSDCNYDVKYPVFLYDSIKMVFTDLEDSFSGFEPGHLTPLEDCRMFLPILVYPVAAIASRLDANIKNERN